MIKINEAVVFLLFLCVLLMAGCNHRETGADRSITVASADAAGEEGTEESDMIKGAELLQQELGIDADCAMGAMETLLEVGGTSLVTVENMNARAGYTARVTDQNGNTYYLGFGGMGYLEIIRKETSDGEILYGATD